MEGFPKSAQEIRERRVFDFVARDLRKIELQSNGKLWVFTHMRDRGTWVLEEPYSAWLSREQFGNWLNQLMNLEVLSFEKPSIVTDVGAATIDRYQLRFFFDAGHEAMTLHVSDEELDVRGYSAFFGDTEDVFTLPKALDNLFNKLGSLVETRVFPVDINAITKMTWTSDGREVIAAREKEEWQLEAPVLMPAQESLMTEIGLSFSRCAATRLLPPVEANEIRKKLKEPLLNASLYTDETADPLEAIFYDSGDEGEWWCVFDGYEGIAEVDALPLSLLNQPLLQFRERTVLDLDPEAVVQVSIRDGAIVQLQWSKWNDAWVADGPLSSNVLGDAIEELLAAVHPLEIEAFETDDMSELEAYGLVEARWEIEFRLLGQIGFRKILKMSEKTNEDGLHYAYFLGKQFIFLLPDSFMQKVF